MCCLQMTVAMDKYLGFKYSFQVWLVDKAKVWNGGVFIYKTIKKTNKKYY